jgi:hypothetical protein
VGERAGGFPSIVALKYVQSTSLSRLGQELKPSKGQRVLHPVDVVYEILSIQVTKSGISYVIPFEEDIQDTAAANDALYERKDELRESSADVLDDLLVWLMCCIVQDMVWSSNVLFCFSLQLSAELRDASDEWLQTVFTLERVKLIDSDGCERLPVQCSKAILSGHCKFVGNGAKYPVKPLMTPKGPVFLEIPRYACNVHGGECYLVPAARPLFGKLTLSPCMIRVGQVRCVCCLFVMFYPLGGWFLLGAQKGCLYTPGFLAFIFSSWVNDRFVVAGVVRNILISWGSCIIDSVATSPSSPVDDSSMVFTNQLSTLVPREATVAGILRGIYNAVVRPCMRQADITMAQLDG